MLEVKFSDELEVAADPVAVAGSGLQDVVLIRADGYRGLMRIEGKVGAAGGINALAILASAIRKGTTQMLANSAATPASDFASTYFRKPGNSASPETTAANGLFWIDLLVDGLSDIVIRAGKASADTTLTITARVASRTKL